MKKLQKHRISKKGGLEKARIKAGLPPGSLIHVGEKLTDKENVELISYNSHRIDVYDNKDPDKIYPLLDNSSYHWINVDGLHNVKMIEGIGSHFKMHHLMLEDVLNTGQRPKSEEYEDHIFFTLKTLNEIAGDEIIYEQISFVLGKNYLISFQEREGDLFDQLRERMKLPDSKLRQRGIDYLFYRLIDIIVDSYYIVLEHVGEKLEKLEDKIYLNPSQKELEDIQELKKELIYLRKTVYPLREAVKKTMDETKLTSEATRQYLTDVYDHTIQLIETIESFRDLTASLIDMYMTSVSNKTNEVMQVLTIIATIFIPLTFIVGVYGMNFDYMPELHYKYGYFITWGVMIIITLFMIAYFRRKRWL